MLEIQFGSRKGLTCGIESESSSDSNSKNEYAEPVAGNDLKLVYCDIDLMQNSQSCRNATLVAAVRLFCIQLTIQYAER